MSTVPVSRIVNVTMLVAASAPQAPSFSRSLCVGSATKLPVYDRLRLYNDLGGVAADFASTDEEYKFALLYFSQSPKPKELMIGRRLLADTAGSLRSGVRNLVLDTYKAVTAGGFDITIDGTKRLVHGIDLSSCTSLDDVAAAVQTAVRVQLAATTVVNTSQGFVITSPTTGLSSLVGYAVAPTTAATSDLSVLMGLTVETNANRVSGAAAEAVQDTLQALQQIDGSWYGFHLTAEATNSDKEAASLWCEASGKFHFVTTSDAPVLDGTSTTDLASVLKGFQYTHTLVQYSSTNAYAAGSAMARGLQVNYDQINSTITLEFKQEPGVTPEGLTATQYAVLDAKNVCYLATVSNGYIMIFNTKTSSGRFFDEIVNLDWFKADAANNAFVAMATSPTKVPQTDKGAQVLVQAIAKTCEKAARNRLAAPGVWTHDGFGSLVNGDFLQQGYYLYASPVAEQSDADRAARKAPPIQGALIGAGAFHSLDLVFNFQR